MHNLKIFLEGVGHAPEPSSRRVVTPSAVSPAHNLPRPQKKLRPLSKSCYNGAIRLA